jgi:predicted Zn-dependent protease
MQQFPGGVNLEPASSALALCGESSKATQAIDTRVKQYPNDTLLNVIRKPAVLATIAMREGKPDEGIRLLEPARRIELGTGPGSAPALVPYTRGLIYLSKKDGANAAVEFRKITERRYLYASSPAFSLSQLGLARAYALQGDSARARTAYQDLLAAWKDGDPELNPLKEAKSEYGKLR